MDTVVVQSIKSSRDQLPTLDNCCLCLGLRVGLNLWLFLEACFWTFMFIAGLVHEVDYIEETELMGFRVLEQEDWYYMMVFGEPITNLTQKSRSLIVILNLLLMLTFLTYLAFCIVLAIGINRYKTSFFIPYFVMDAIFMLLALIGCFVGFFISSKHLCAVSFVFLVIKLYFEICIISLFKDYRGKVEEPINAGSVSAVSEHQVAPV